tara:strand:+ start:919 stop:1320 length:402 start_codon:yes stop_codon:yes gene_type:complete
MIFLKKLEKIFKMNTIAVVGMSPKIERPSHYVSQYMIENGFEIIPVNPGHNTIAGLQSYPSLDKIPKKVDIVNVFRRSKFVESIAKDAVKINAKALWLQDGVVDIEAGKFAEDAGLIVIMNDCILRQHIQFKN